MAGRLSSMRTACAKAANAARSTANKLGENDPPAPLPDVPEDVPAGGAGAFGAWAGSRTADRAEAITDAVAAAVLVLEATVVGSSWFRAASAELSVAVGANGAVAVATGARDAGAVCGALTGGGAPSFGAS
jgi:hypothetical protein